MMGASLVIGAADSLLKKIEIEIGKIRKKVEILGQEMLRRQQSMEKES
jgi:hypothetical protein